MTVFKDFHDVLKYVRLPLLNPYFLHDCVENQPVITETRACQVSYFLVLPHRHDLYLTLIHSYISSA